MNAFGNTTLVYEIHTKYVTKPYGISQCYS